MSSFNAATATATAEAEGIRTVLVLITKGTKKNANDCIDDETVLKESQ